MLLAQTYKTSQYDVFTIHELKEQQIFRFPYFPGRIAHHAIMNALEPIWVSVFTDDTYSRIKNRGIHVAAKRVKYDLKTDPKGTIYCLKIGVRKFYPSTDHDILKQVVRRKIKGKRLLQLLDEIIDSADGVPIGNYLSQYFTNLYLAYFDHWIKEVKQVRYFYHCADDIVVLSSSKESLRTLLREIRVYLRDNLKLEIKHNFQVFPIDSRGVDFLGYRFFHTHTLLRRSIKQGFCRRVAESNKKTDIKFESFKQQICSWWGRCKYCDLINLVNKLLEDLAYEISFKR